MKSIYSVQTTQTPASFKDVDNKKGIVTGYFASFNNVDSDGDIIVKGAFSKSIGDMGPQSNNPRIKHLLNHNVDQPLGVILSLNEDTKGLAYESQIGTHALGMDFIKMVESGLITEHSIGYSVIDSEKGKEARILKKLMLMEGSSLTAWGANHLTPLTGMKSLFELDFLVEKQKRIEKFCKSTTATDETIEMLLLHTKQLSQIILDIQATQQVETIEQDSLKNWDEALTIFTKNINQ